MTCATACGIGGAQRLQALNESCACMPIDSATIEKAVAGDSQLLQTAFTERPVLFAQTPVFLCAADVHHIQNLIRVVEAITKTPTYTAMIKNRSPADDLLRTTPTPGLFMAYDFHITIDGPRLIEINTNAGGAFLVQSLYDPVASDTPLCGGHWGMPGDPDWIYQMLVHEWQSAGHTGTPKQLAIVDDAPESQFLHPDFELARRYFESRGVEVFIADPSECVLNHGRLNVRDREVDMVYNRVTDFYFTDAAHHGLLETWKSGAAVVSPSPDHHAKFADKRNLAWLSDPDHQLRATLSNTAVEILNTIPHVQEVNDASAKALWSDRKHLFFKLANGFAGRGAYRGAKLTRRVWNEILQRPAGSYVAQNLINAPMRLVGEPAQTLKYDVRAYTYDGEIKLLAARIYQGQTTNFRTPGGGFAPVVILDDNPGEAQPCHPGSTRPPHLQTH